MSRAVALLLAFVVGMMMRPATANVDRGVEEMAQCGEVRDTAANTESRNVRILQGVRKAPPERSPVEEDPSQDVVASIPQLAQLALAPSTIEAMSAVVTPLAARGSAAAEARGPPA
jgi:hypothetical protein